MPRALIYIATIIIGAFILPFTPSSSALFTLITGIMVGLAITLIDILVANTRFVRLGYYSAKYNRRHIRISVSYLFRIKVDGSYLLIKGHRWDHYQPVGGVYKTSPGAKASLNKMNALDDNLVPIDEVSEHDLRIRIPARQIIPFVRWFESEHSRETSPWREFHEELIGSGILSGDDFPFIFHDFIRREIRPIRYSHWADSMEILIADIYELLPTPDQFKALKGLKKSGNPQIVYASEDQIRHLGITPGKNLDLRISETAIWTL